MAWIALQIVMVLALIGAFKLTEYNGVFAVVCGYWIGIVYADMRRHLPK